MTEGGWLAGPYVLTWYNEFITCSSMVRKINISHYRLSLRGNIDLGGALKGHIVFRGSVLNLHTI